jgi:hypothetical protein
MWSGDINQRERRDLTFLRKAIAGRVAKTTETLIGDGLVNAVFTGGYAEMIRQEIDNGAERGLAVTLWWLSLKWRSDVLR